MPRYAIALVVTANNAERAWEETADRIAPWGNFIGDPRDIEALPEYDSVTVARTILEQGASDR